MKRRGKKPKTRRWKVIAQKFDDEQPVVGVEVGVNAGGMSAMLLQLMPQLTLYMVDRWAEYSAEERSRDPDSGQPRLPQEEWEARYEAALAVAAHLGKRAKILRMSSADAAGQFDNRSLDFVFIDADHSYEGVRDDIKRWLPKVKPGGYLCGHDYHHKKYPKPGVDRAVDEAFGSAVRAGKDNTWLYRAV